MAESDLSQHFQIERDSGLGNYSVSNTKCINVLLVGRSQTGKSTIIQTLLDPRKGTSSTGFSDTRDPELNTLILTDQTTKQAYQFNIVDTPGLKEVRQSGTSRTDDELLKLTSKCVEEHITSLNVVCFVSRAGDTHRLDTEVYRELKQFLGNKFSGITMMVLTHCDEYIDSRLDEFEKNIRAHEVSKPYFEYCKLGIVRYGAIDLNKLESLEEEIRTLVLESKLRRIEKMRDNFLKKIISCSDNGLKVAQLQRIHDEAKKVHEQVIKEQVDKERQKDSCNIL